MRSQLDFEAQFASEADCLQYLREMRWPGGFSCPSARVPQRGSCTVRRGHRLMRGLGHCRDKENGRGQPR